MRAGIEEAGRGCCWCQKVPGTGELTQRQGTRWRASRLGSRWGWRGQFRGLCLTDKAFTSALHLSSCRNCKNRSGQRWTGTNMNWLRCKTSTRTNLALSRRDYKMRAAATRRRWLSYNSSCSSSNQVRLDSRTNTWQSPSCADLHTWQFEHTSSSRLPSSWDRQVQFSKHLKKVCFSNACHVDKSRDPYLYCVHGCAS